ncbi:site-specific DNA-methyltransferase [Leptospira barantonii]|uniref:Methyltransferase n=1 Tax=Leptospira barantonii TaxID=2023184 RepID=A0A5F2BGZ1_9LEPT|nr:site-specific DNA-methyltransferase [Leptospira barantonii]TGM04829.1 site-specific DNA-methyltransferase [Leptospira barantonii]
MSFEILHGNSIKVIQRLKTDQNLLGQVDSVVTSPPYFQKRTYLDKADSNLSFELGREKNPNEFLRNLATVFLEARPLLKDSATLFINLGDTFRGGQALGIPSGFVRVMKRIGYHFIQEIVWAKSITTKEGNRGSCKPESVTRRFTNSHEYVLFFVKDKEEYYFDGKSVSVPINGIHHENQSTNSLLKIMGANKHSLEETNGLKDYSLTNAQDPTGLKNRIIKNKIKNQDFTARRRSVWQIATPNSRDRHTAVGPEELFEICIKAGTPIDGLVFDPFVGEGTTGKAALRNERSFLGIDLDKRSCLEAKNNLDRVFESLAS